MKFLRIYLIVTLVALVSACNKPNKKGALDELKDASAEMREELQKEMESGGLSVDKPVDNSGLIAALDKAEKSASGQDKLAVNLARTALTRKPKRLSSRKTRCLSSSTKS